MVRLGDGGVKLPETKEGCEDTRESLAEDEQFWADRDESRSTKQGEWVSRCKLRTEEIPAIVDTNKILNEDEALEVFGKTLPGVASRLQVKATSKEMKQMTLAALQGVKGNVGVDLIPWHSRARRSARRLLLILRQSVRHSQPLSVRGSYGGWLLLVLLLFRVLVMVQARLMCVAPGLSVCFVLRVLHWQLCQLIGGTSF